MPPQSLKRFAVAATIAVLTATGVPTGADALRQSAAATSVCEVTTAERLVAIGDVHGAYDKFTGILRDAGLIDGSQKWAGGRTVFVQTGDVVDRGADSRKALDLVRKLEADAPKSGGRVIALLGNHEVMRMLGDLRYVSAGEYAAFKDPGSSDLRDAYYQQALGNAKETARAEKKPFDEREFKKDFLDKVPLGFIEMQRAFAADGEYGRWLRSHNTMAIVNGVAFMHGGTAPKVADLGCPAINARVTAELSKLKLSSPEIETSLLAGAQGPLWYRGLVHDPPEVDANALAGIFDALHVHAMVVGHTPTPGHMRQTFDGRVTQIDTGMLAGDFFPGGVASAIEIKDKTFTAIYAGGRREPLSAPAVATYAARH